MRPQTALIIVIKGDVENIFQCDDFFVVFLENLDVMEFFFALVK